MPASPSLTRSLTFRYLLALALVASIGVLYAERPAEVSRQIADFLADGRELAQATARSAGGMRPTNAFWPGRRRC